MHIHTVCKSDFSLLGLCICVCIICACMAYIVCMRMYAVCIVCICPDTHGCQHNVPKRPPAGAAPRGPHEGHPWAGGRPLFSAIGDPPRDPFWRTRARSTHYGIQSAPPCAANRHSTRISRSASTPRAPSAMIWVGSAVQRRRVQPPLPHKIPSRH
jgi:hypothetical protein